MNIVCGVYGYEITKIINLSLIRLEPRTENYKQAKEWARDEKKYHLTGVLVCEDISDELIFNIEAILSFIEHMDVLISSPKKIESGDIFSSFTDTIITHRRSNGGGAVIGEDTFFHDSRAVFIEKAICKLQDANFCKKTKFNILFFKCVERFRQRKQFVEVSYFLLYSGLESFSRSVVEDTSNKNSSEPICKLLKEYGFDVKVENPNDLKRAVSTYTHLRNALFHNSQFVANININGIHTELKLFDYLFHIEHLVVLVILKAIGFDDEHINWNSWIDHQPFK